MASRFETGHFINLSNFGTLLTYLATQPAYLPDAAALQLVALEQYRQEVNTATNTLVTAGAVLQQEVNNRQELFEQTRTLARRLMRYLTASSTDHEAIKDVNTHYRMLFARPVSRRIIVQEDGTVAEKAYSGSRLSFHSMAENFQKMVERIATMPHYAPADNSIGLTTLQDRYQELHTTNSGVNTQYQMVHNARYNRDLLMYKTDTGMLALARRVKRYLQYKYGLGSEQYHYANALRFTGKQIRTGELLDETPES